MSFLRTAMSRAAYTAPPANEEEPVERTPRTKTLDDMEAEIRGIEQHVVSLQCELDRAGRAYTTARADLIRAQNEFCERLKDSGIRGEAVRVPPELELIPPRRAGGTAT